MEQRDKNEDLKRHGSWNRQRWMMEQRGMNDGTEGHE